MEQNTTEAVVRPERRRLHDDNAVTHCAHCAGPLYDGRVIVTPSGHVIHPHCEHPWLRRALPPLI